MDFYFAKPIIPIRYILEAFWDAKYGMTLSTELFPLLKHIRTFSIHILIAFRSQSFIWFDTVLPEFYLDGDGNPVATDWQWPTRTDTDRTWKTRRSWIHLSLEFLEVLSTFRLNTGHFKPAENIRKIKCRFERTWNSPHGSFKHIFFILLKFTLNSF